MSDVSNSLDAFARWAKTIERRLRSLELGAELLAQSTTEAVHRLDARLEALEMWRTDGADKRWADRTDERLGKLEAMHVVAHPVFAIKCEIPSCEVCAAQGKA